MTLIAGGRAAGGGRVAPSPLARRLGYDLTRTTRWRRDRDGRPSPSETAGPGRLTVSPAAREVAPWSWWTTP